MYNVYSVWYINKYPSYSRCKYSRGFNSNLLYLQEKIKVMRVNNPVLNHEEVLVKYIKSNRITLLDPPFSFLLELGWKPSIYYQNFIMNLSYNKLVKLNNKLDENK